MAAGIFCISEKFVENIVGLVENLVFSIYTLISVVKDIQIICVITFGHFLKRYIPFIHPRNLLAVL